MRVRWLLMACVAAMPLQAMAQEDFRHADEGRPIRVEDAYPIKFGEWEWELGVLGELAEGSSSSVSTIELKFGFARNLQVGIEADGGWARDLGVVQSGIEEFGAHLLYNLNQESHSAPALGLRADIATPGVGGRGSEEWGGAVKGMLTKSVGLFRAHLNGGYTWASVMDGGDFWSIGLALDRPLGLTSKLLLGDVYLESPSQGGGGGRIWADVGSRVQISKTMVLDFGVTSRVDMWADGTPNVGVVIGLSRAFGFAGLINVPAYPNPRIN